MPGKRAHAPASAGSTGCCCSSTTPATNARIQSRISDFLPSAEHTGGHGSRDKNRRRSQRKQTRRLTEARPQMPFSLHAEFHMPIASAEQVVYVCIKDPVAG